MKRIKSILYLFALSVGLFSCIKNDPITLQDTYVEFDAATWNSNNAYVGTGLDSIAFPIMTRVPAFGRVVNTGDATLSRTSGTIPLRVNLVGATRKSATEVTYETITNYTLIGTPPANNTAAVAGTHYTALPGTLTIPADSSFGYLNVPILNPGAGTGTRELVIRLKSATDAKINRNYSVVGLRIAQP
ncbi:MAG: hypothetical protein JWP27_478 [Flaviaesturariibacter sp.]|nr:hypothetical protein [Flaviaesturariibacter sp.]